MSNTPSRVENKEIFETMPVPAALLKMAIPTIASQLINLIYNIADTWFIGQTNNPYMVAAASLALGVVFISISLANFFSVGGGTLVVRLLGSKEEEEARKAASLTLLLTFLSSVAFSLVCLTFMDPLLYLLGASENTIGFARQYMFYVVILGCPFSVTSNVMSTMVRNMGYSKEASFGLGMGGFINLLLDPLFMFVLMPPGHEVMGAAVATMLSHVITFLYFLYMYGKLKDRSILSIPRRLERIQRSSMRAFLSVGLTAAASGLLYDIAHMSVSRLSASHGDMAVAALGIVMKVERLPNSIGIGFCLAMVPLAAYNYASHNRERMRAFFNTARLIGLSVGGVFMILYRLFAPQVIRIFIEDAETIRLGTQFLQARCFAIPFMFLCFHMVHFLQGINRGTHSLTISFVRQACLNIPLQILLNYLFGISGLVWSQTVTDVITIAIAYYIYHRLMKQIETETINPV